MGTGKSFVRHGKTSFAITSMAFHRKYTWCIFGGMYCGHFVDSDVELTDNSGLSWSLKTSLCPIAKPVSEEQRNFAQSIKIAQPFRPWSSENGTTLAFGFPSARILRGFTQKMTWRFRLTNNSQYFLDVIKAERFDVAPVKPGNHRKLLDSHWTVEIQHERWAVLARPLPRGTSSGLKVSDIFPDNGKAYDIDSSLEGFVDTMRQIVDTLHSSQVSP